MIIKPKTTLQSLPNDTILVSSIVIITILGVSGLLQRVLIIENKDMIFVSSVMGFFIGLVLTFLAAYILSVIIQFFGVKISFSKIFNIACFVQIPRLIFSLIFTILYYSFPTLIRNSSYNQVANMVVMLVAIYSLILMLYGLKLEHSKNKK